MIGISDFARGYLRNRATGLMGQSKDACQIRRPGPQKVVYDPVSRKTVTYGGAEVYAGPCRLWSLPAGSASWVQDRELTTTRTRLSLPYGVDTPEPGDLVTMTGSDDPEVVGRSLRITGVTRGGGLRGSRVMEVTFIDFEEEGDV